MTTKEEQQKALNAKRRLRNKQIAQLRASNEMLEAAKENIIDRYGEDSETTEQLLKDIDVAKEQNLERAKSYLGASKNEVESAMYNKVNPKEEKAYFDRLKRQGKSDEELHVKDLTKGGKKNIAKTTAKPKSKLAELTDRLRKLNSKLEDANEIEIEDNILDEVPPEEIIAPNAGDITLVPINERFDDIPLDEIGKPIVAEENSVENKEKTEKKETVTEAVREIKQEIKPVDTKFCKDFDPRDIPSYIQYDIIPLPSKGECYPHKKGNIPVAYLTAADENLITSRNMYESGSMIDVILERKILDKSIRVKDLCKGDRDAIAIWLRATAYGPEYPIVATYNDEEIESVIDLSDIHFLDFKLKGDEKGWFDYKVTSNGDLIKFKILSYGEESELIKNNATMNDVGFRSSVVDYMDKSIDYINGIDANEKSDIIEALNAVKNWCLNINMTSEEIKSKVYSTYITDRMIMQTMSVNGNTDREYIKNYIENMVAHDAIEYRKYVNENIPGVDLNVTIPIPESMGGGSFDTFLSIGETIFINVR
jgi:hypothetical protein